MNTHAIGTPIESEDIRLMKDRAMKARLAEEQADSIDPPVVTLILLVAQAWAELDDIQNLLDLAEREPVKEGATASAQGPHPRTAVEKHLVVTMADIERLVTRLREIKLALGSLRLRIGS